jgi:hypothetical protein
MTIYGITQISKVAWGFLAQPLLCAEMHADVQVSVHYYRPIVTKIGMCQQILVKLPNIKFNENPFRHS